jgi:uncharacterized membrane-anchored protein YhcB (DUF1043 family)
MSENTGKYSSKKLWIYSIAGMVAGIILCAILMISIMPSMINEEKMLEGLLL